MKPPANCRLIGRWRLNEADLWDRAHLDLSAPATLTITAQGGEIAFGVLQAGLEVEDARDSIGFSWAGSDEGDQVEGEGTAELLDDGSIEIEFAYDNEAVLKAKRMTSSTPCCWSQPTVHAAFSTGGGPTLSLTSQGGERSRRLRLACGRR